MFRRLVVALSVIVATGVFVSAEARKKRTYSGDQLVVISEQDIDLGLDKYTIDVSKAKGAYKGIRVRNASGRLFDLSRVQVVYSDGSVHNEDRQIDMWQGERSRLINPTGDSRFVDQINIVQTPGNGRGRLQVLGVQDEDGRSMDRTGGGGRYSAPSTAPTTTTTTTPTGRPDEALSGAVPVKPTTEAPTTAAPGAATAGGDVLFGAQYVGFGVDRDVIRVGNEIGKFDKIRLRVLDNDIHINEIKVVYANGETDALAVNADIPKNSRTNWIDLKGDRFIKEIQMVYKSKPSFKGQARIEVFGQYADGWLGPQGEGRKYNQGWVLLGAQTAGFVGFDKDVIPVGRNEGGFRKIRVTVRDRAITLNEVNVIFTDGSQEMIPVRTRVDAGGTYGPVDLKGEKRASIDRIEAKYRSRFFDASARGKGAAIVEVWGQH
ncbi:MAG: DUF2541 family protein [Hyphomicrobium sp.]|nr:DUF2541 family protein [Hyphomicrobium sp.]